MFQKATRNLHFTRPATMVITMGFPFVVAFEVEVVEQDSKYEKILLLRDLVIGDLIGHKS